MLSILYILIAGLYHALVYTAEKFKIGFFWCLSIRYRTLYLQRGSKYRCVTAVANANGVLVRLIYDGSDPRYIRLCLILL